MAGAAFSTNRSWRGCKIQAAARPHHLPPTPVWKEAVVAAAPPCPGSFQGALAAEAVGLLGGGAGICTYSCGGCGDGLSFFCYYCTLLWCEKLAPPTCG